MSEVYERMLKKLLDKDKYKSGLKSIYEKANGGVYYLKTEQECKELLLELKNDIETILK